jgi:excisionase family DNA binding protein
MWISFQALLSTAAVAKWLGIATRTVCLWAECEEIPALKIGKQWRFREEDVRRWLEQGAARNRCLRRGQPAPLSKTPAYLKTYAL